MKKFGYKRAESFEGAGQIQKEEKNAVFLAGGTDLLGTMKADILPEYPQVLVDLKRIPGAKGICREGDVLKIGALTTLKELEEDQTVLTCAPILSEAARSVATPLIRSRGTVGGNLC